MSVVKPSEDILSPTPSEEQVKAWNALTPQEQVETLDEAIEAGLNSGDSELTVKEIYEDVFKKPFKG